MDSVKENESSSCLFEKNSEDIASPVFLDIYISACDVSITFSYSLVRGMNDFSDLSRLYNSYIFEVNMSMPNCKIPLPK